MATTIGVTLPALSLSLGSGLTVAYLRQFITTALSDSALQALLNAAVAAINDVLGEPGEVVEVQTRISGDLLPLARRAGSITSVVEGDGASPVTLAGNDYELSSTRRYLRRLTTGTNPRWQWRTRVRTTYVPVDDTADRARAAVALVKLDIVHNPGLAAQSIGTWAEQYTSNSAFNYELERASILSSLETVAGVR